MPSKPADSFLMGDEEGGDEAPKYASLGVGSNRSGEICSDGSDSSREDDWTSAPRTGRPSLMLTPSLRSSTIGSKGEGGFCGRAIGSKKQTRMSFIC